MVFPSGCVDETLICHVGCCLPIYAARGVAATPDAAHAFVYNGKEYFDVTFGISPLAWGFAAFCIIFYGATVKNAAQKYNKPWGTNTIKDPKPPKMGAKFVGLEIENKVDSYKAV
jgi:hypothetical protein